MAKATKKTDSKLKKFLTQLVIVAIIFYTLPIFWYQYNELDELDVEENGDYFLSVQFLMSTGLLMCLMSFTYLWCTSVDIIPNIIPILGNIDELVFKMIFGAGMMLMYCGYTFGKGTTPKEFSIVVSVVKFIYTKILEPLFSNIIFPILIPLLKALAIPMKAIAKSILGLVLDKVRDATTADDDPSTQQQAFDVIKDAVKDAVIENVAIGEKEL